MVQSYNKSLMRINDQLIESIELYSQLPWYLRWDFAPFAVTYAFLFISIFSTHSTIKVFRYFIRFLTFLFTIYLVRRVSSISGIAFLSCYAVFIIAMVRSN